MKKASGEQLSALCYCCKFRIGVRDHCALITTVVFGFRMI